MPCGPSADQRRRETVELVSYLVANASGAPVLGALSGAPGRSKAHAPDGVLELQSTALWTT